MTRIAIRHVTRADQDAEQIGLRDLAERVESFSVDVPAMANGQIRQEMDSLRATILHHAGAPSGLQEGVLGPLLLRHEQLRVELNRRGVSRFGSQ
jgi:hypothetical protein